MDSSTNLHPSNSPQNRINTSNHTLNKISPITNLATNPTFSNTNLNTSNQQQITPVKQNPYDPVQFKSKQSSVNNMTIQQQQHVQQQSPKYQSSFIQPTGQLNGDLNNLHMQQNLSNKQLHSQFNNS